VLVQVGEPQVQAANQHVPLGINPDVVNKDVCIGG
jgi:hypothetical protein